MWFPAKYRALIIGCCVLFSASAHDIITTNLTFTRDISRIFVRRCQSCHSTASSIPLMTYEQTRPWSVSIKEQVLSRQMPPWGAVKGYGNLSPDNGLTQEEIQIIAAWVVGGAPKGNPFFLPPAGTKSPVLSPKLKDAFVVNSKIKIDKPLHIAGIRPITNSNIESSRIFVTFPDGHVEPLVWLYRYNPAWQQTFRFKKSIILPVGSVVQSGSPLQFALETSR